LLRLKDYGYICIITLKQEIMGLDICATSRLKRIGKVDWDN